MRVSGFGNQARPCLRAFVFMVFLTFMTLLYHYYDLQYSNFIDYSPLEISIKNYNESDIPEEKLKDGYIVWSSSCRIPNISAFHESIKKFVHKWKAVTCSKTRPLTTLIYNAKSGESSLKILLQVAGDYKVKAEEIRCCYKTITRKELKKVEKERDDDRYNLSAEKCFTNQTKLEKSTEYLYIECHGRGWLKKKFYQNIHSIVVEKTPRVKSSKNDSSAAKYSVFLFGIDSISRLNLIRTMPKSKRFVDEHGWVPLEGYNKIADNTFPNVMAILTGWNLTQVDNRCFKSPKQPLDSCPYLWKNYSQSGYLTAYMEDEPSIGTFNYHKYGFLNSPTDYYSRPFMVFGEQNLNRKSDGGMSYCMGIQPQAEYLYQYNTDFVQRLHNRPYFNLFWTNSYSHNDVNMPAVMDARIRRFLEDIQPYLNSTIVLFFSDHGVRFGPIRETFVGWMEERLPFMYLWIPPSFRAAYPRKFANLVANKNRLTSPFDVHATLQDILYGRVVRKPDACPTCDTLFRKVAWNRSCEDAGITSHWCTCSNNENDTLSTNDPVVVNAAHHAVQRMNDFMALRSTHTKAGTQCAVLNLKQIMSVRTRVTGVAMFSKQVYVTVFEVQPSGGLFEATWDSRSKAEGLDNISRINMYGNQSSCVVDDSELKKYCFCLKA